MSMALELAERGRHTVTPNPMVGCVIVKNGKVVGSGYHLRAGEPHAEIYALSNAGVEAHDATVYVTLEPCCHQGRTPPCVKALIEARVKKSLLLVLMQILWFQEKELLHYVKQESKLKLACLKHKQKN